MERLSSKLKQLRNTYNHWGGPTAAFFAYAHGSHDQVAGLLVALLPFVRADLGLNYLQSGLLLSAYSVTSGASQFLGGWLGDRVSRYLFIAVGLAGVGLTSLFVGLSSSFSVLLGILVVMGIFSGAYHPSAASMISGCFEEAKRGKAIAVHMLGGSIGFALGPILGGVIAGMFGWRFAYILISVPTLIAVVVVLKKFKQWENLRSDDSIINPAMTDDDSETESGRLSLMQVVRSVFPVTSLAIITQLVVGSAVAFIPLYLVDQYSASPAYAAVLVGMIRSGGMPGSLFGGWLSDRWGRMKAITLSFVLTGPLLFLMTNIPLNVTLVLVFVIFGLVIQMRQSTVQPYLMDRTPHYIRSTIFGIYFGLSMEGQSLLQPVVGYLIDKFGINEIFQIITLISIALSVLALLLLKKPGFMRSMK